MAASAASYIALMADKVTMNDYSMFMIHNAWGICIGNRDEMREMADRLEKIDGTIAGVIAARSSMELDEVKDAMSAETWYRGDEALEVGMCDEVIETQQRVAASIDRAIAERYRNIPEGIELSDGGASEPTHEPGNQTSEADDTTDPVCGPFQQDGPENGASHALSNLCDNEVKDAEGAILLGNRVYRKEQ